jgi:hypothetical protein
MTRMEDKDITRADNGLAGKQWVWRGTPNVVQRGKGRRIIVRKHLGVLILSILLAVRTLISWAKVAVRIMFRQGS